MLIQLHIQNVYDLDDVKLVAQADWSESGLKTQEELHAWMRSIYEANPLCDGDQWLVCTEDYSGFVGRKDAQ